MSKNKVIQAMSAQVIESVMAEDAAAQPASVVFIPITVTAALSVPTKYLEDIERSTETVRAFMESLAQEFDGVVLTADIK